MPDLATTLRAGAGRALIVVGQSGIRGPDSPLSYHFAAGAGRALIVVGQSGIQARDTPLSYHFCGEW